MTKKKASAKGKNVSAPMPMSEKKWRAECDARTLADAAAIKRDSSRMNAARKAAKSLVCETDARAKEQQAQARAMKSLAEKK